MAKIILNRNNMKKIFITIFLIIFIFNFLNAEESKKDKKYENMSEEQLLAEFMKSDKELKQEKTKTAQSEQELKDVKKMRKTASEINNILGTDKK